MKKALYHWVIILCLKKKQHFSFGLHVFLSIYLTAREENIWSQSRLGESDLMAGDEVQTLSSDHSVRLSSLKKCSEEQHQLSRTSTSMFAEEKVFVTCIQW